jgi:pyruvate,water dikinase
MAETKLTFESPGPGTWELETAHQTRPLTKLGKMAMIRRFDAGFQQSFADYGSMLIGMESEMVNGFRYTRFRPVGAPEKGGGPPPKWVLKLMVHLHPELRRRRKAADQSFRDRRWRTDMDRWENEVKPRSIARHQALLDVDVAAISDEELLTHIEECVEHWGDMGWQHAYFSTAAMLPAGDFMLSVSEWTDRTVPELLPIFQGISPHSSGWVPEVDPMIEAIKGSETAQALMDSSRPAAEVLAELRAHPEVGESVERYLRVVGYRIIGYDIGDTYALENPHILLSNMRGLMTRQQSDAAEIGDARAAEIRSEVAPEHHAAFDEALADARRNYPLRDERGLYSDSWAAGILRRAMLEAGRRLVEKGLVADAADAVEADGVELRTAFAGGDEATALGRELGERRAYRFSVTTDDAPKVLGPEPTPPPPLDLIPAGGLRRGMAAFGALMGEVMAQTTTGEAGRKVIEGRGAGLGVYEGTARIIEGSNQFDRIQQGDVLITRATSPTFNVVLGHVGAIVTDYGGILSHAAIVAREFGLPAVVACGDASTVIPDGARVRVDSAAGTVTILG